MYTILATSVPGELIVVKILFQISYLGHILITIFCRRTIFSSTKISDIYRIYIIDIYRWYISCQPWLLQKTKHDEIETWLSKYNDFDFGRFWQKIVIFDFDFKIVTALINIEKKLFWFLRKMNNFSSSDVKMFLHHSVRDCIMSFKFESHH